MAVYTFRVSSVASLVIMVVLAQTRSVVGHERQLLQKSSLTDSALGAAAAVSSTGRMWVSCCVHGALFNTEDSDVIGSIGLLPNKCCSRARVCSRA